ncbi:MAG TPA: DUF5011 domain-containing protein [Candidatus Hydrogenedentes bacterium]|nr:DUF5011 domain-containing protein [Candidatus Hydrogenedentota bacterium]
MAATSGGGIANVSGGTLDANAALMNVIVLANTANRTDDGYLGGSPMRGGGGIFNDNASPNMTWVSVLNNAIAASASPFGAAGAGMYSFVGSPVVNSSIFWGNTGGTSEIEDNTTFGDLSATTVTYSDANLTNMAWAGDGSYSFPLTSPAAGIGNIYADPVLLNWIPQPGSPVIDTADPMLMGDDITAALRPVDGDAVPGAVCDMGAIEWVHAPTVACLSAALNISLQTSITDPLTLFDGTNSTVEGGIWRLEVAANTFGCAEIPGPTPVRVTVYDNRGQSGFCDAPVSAFETTNPVVVTNTITRQLNGSGSYALTNADVQALGAGSSDNCGVNWAASSVTPSTLTCAALGGPVNVTITVVDTSGNSASGTAQVVMQDVTAPTAVGASINVNLDLAGSYTLTSGDMQALGAGSTDNCSINWGATTATPATFDCTDLGANSVTVTVYDTSGNSATATGTVNVADVTPAIISGVSPKSFVTPGPDFTSASALAGVTANDGCAGPVTVTVECRDALNNVVPFPIPDTFDTGSTYPYNFTLIYSAADGNGNTATLNTTLTLQNNTPPVITITGGTPVSVQCGATYTDQGATAMDAESGDLTAFVTVLSGLPVNTGSVGSATVRYQVQDPVTGVTVTRDRLVNIIDTTNPTVVGNNITRALVGNAYTLSAADIQAMGAGSFDSCGGINWATSTATPSSFTCANVGTPVNVTLTLRDNAGNSASATVQVTITDDTDPVLAGVVNRSFRTPGPDFTSAQALSGVSATDNCATGITPTVVCRDAANNVVAFPIPDTYPTGGVYPYTFTLTYTADDGNGNTATQVANLVLTQNLPPVITIVGADPATVECGASYTDEGATVTDPDDPAPALGTTGLPVDTSTLGQKLVVYSATDVSSGVTVTETREVNVVDTTGPVVVTNNITRTLPVSNTYTITLADRQAVGAGSTDSCGTIDWAGSLITPGTFNCSNVGPNNVTITVRDSNGNTNTGSAVITIVDATLPVISGVSNKAFMTPGADFTEAQALAGVSASDTCTGSRTVTVVCRDALNNVVPFPVPDTFPTGGTYPYIFTLTYTADDGNGNTDTETANLTLTNDNPPVITITGANPATVQCGSAYADEGATASDVESGDLTGSIVATGLPIDTSAVASANVGYSVTDPATGVVVTATRVVNIVDTTAPAAVCNPISVTLAGNSYALAPADIQAIGAGSSDACGGIDWANSTVVPSSFTCADVGTPVTVTLTVFDTAGLSASCSTTVTVLDDTDPVLAGVADKAFRTPGGDFTLAAALSGVTATDNCAGTLTGSVAVECRDAANTVVPFPVPDDYPTGGVYPYTFTLNYSVSDGNGNTATQTANLVLTQNLPPVITVIGADPATVECGAAYADEGATVSDPDDPAPALSTSGLPIDTSSPNTFTVTYSAIDVASGVEVTATRTVNVVDTTGPVVVTNPITRNLSSGTYTVSVADRQAIAAGSTDSCGTIDWNASRIIPGTFTCANRGANTVEVRVVDSNGNQTISSATLTINDVTAPVISGVSDKAFMTPGPDFTSAQALAGVSATDTCDGARTVNVECRDASNNVVAFPVPDTYPTGGVYPYVFTLTYTSTDTSANVRTQVANLTLTDDNPPVITITGANPATVECGTTYMDDGATATDVESGDLTSQISATGLPIPVGTPGTYAVVYSVTDPLTSVTVSESRQVDVVDTTPPTLTLFGSTLIGVATGGSYTDPLYTASDSCAGDLTGSVLVGGDTVNTAVPGTYVVTYNVTDGYNAAPQQTRTIVVTNLLWFSTQPTGAIVYVDAAPVALTAVFEDGLNPTTYQWFVASNGGAEVAVGAPLAVPGDRTLTLAVDPAAYGVGSHVFVVRVTDDTGVRSSASATVVVGSRMSVTDGLENKTLTIGADFTWSITVTGGIGTLNYQWLKDDGSKAFVPVSDGGGISGSTTAALVITGFTADMAGDYQVEVSDDFDNIVVGPATLGLGSGLPAAGGLGLAALAALTALGGAVTIRRRK